MLHITCACRTHHVSLKLMQDTLAGGVYSSAAYCGDVLNNCLDVLPACALYLVP